MDTKIVVYLGLILIMFFAIKKAGKMFRVSTDGNLIKSDQDITMQAIIVFFMGIAVVFTIMFADKIISKFGMGLAEIILWSELALMAINLAIFLVMLLKAVGEFILYRKRSLTWLIIGIHFGKNLLLGYLVYNYYLTILI